MSCILPRGFLFQEIHASSLERPLQILDRVFKGGTVFDPALNGGVCQF
jgi:hypothetical protein